ncbi:hypothetical protein QOZ80_2BG0190380 [Eleusine coracana subsp. coracana]|nr:hypothetical protein QOZ80_2BG0190380 [Eleusine coracana subsp. coracana]
MEKNVNYVYLCVALVSLLLAALRKRRRSKDGLLHLPPGPWQLPIIGSLHHVAWQRQLLPHRAMRDLARRHGPVMLLRIGAVPTVVVSSPDAAREVTRTHDAAFASRPLTATFRALTGGGRGIIFAPYGDSWRQLRRLAVTELLSARRILSFRAVRAEEVAAMLRDVDVDLRARLSALVADVTVRAVIGGGLGPGGWNWKERDVFLRELDRTIELASAFNPADLWPSASWLAGGGSSVRRAEACRDTVFGILDGIYQGAPGEDG